jgi:hypothetical protein
MSLDSQQPGPHDTVDAAVKAVKPPRGKSRAQLVPAHPESQELGPCDYAILALRERRDGQVKPTRSTFRGHMPQKVERMKFRPRRGRPGRPPTPRAPRR